MNFNIVILSDRVLGGDEFLDLSSFCKLLNSYGIVVDEINLKNYTQSMQFEKNTILFLHDEQIDDFVSINKIFYEANSEIIDQEAIVCGKDFAVAVLPIESNKNLHINVLNKIKERFSLKEILTYRLFGKTVEQVQETLQELEMSSKPLVKGKGLLVDIYLEKQGKQGFISQEEILINERFSENIYSQNYMDMSDVINKSMQFTKSNIILKDSFTNGQIASELLSKNSSERITTETFNILKEVNYIKVGEKCYRDEGEMVYHLSASILDLHRGDIAVVISGSKSDTGYNIFLAVGKMKAIDVYNFKVEGNREDSIVVAKNLTMFNLIKKLREKDFEN